MGAGGGGDGGVTIALDKEGISSEYFFFLHEFICSGYSLEAPRRGASNEYPQQMLYREIKK